MPKIKEVIPIKRTKGPLKQAIPLKEAIPLKQAIPLREAIPVKKYNHGNFFEKRKNR